MVCYDITTGQWKELTRFGHFFVTRNALIDITLFLDLLGCLSENGSVTFKLHKSSLQQMTGCAVFVQIILQ